MSKTIVCLRLGIIIVIVILTLLPIMRELKNKPAYSYIATEQNRRAGTTLYTLIYIYKGEVKYFYYDQEETKKRFLNVTGMKEK